MPIRSKPFDEITAADALELIEREVTENRTLDFKQELKLDDSGKFELLKDVVAMANASGGTILYGAVEGDDERRGQIVGLRPMALEKDRDESTISNILRDGIDERINGVLHRAVPYDGGFLYIVRVPQSPLAPHMVTVRSSRPRFYLRATVTNDPMDARQIKEAALRASSAEERAQNTIEQRTSVLHARAANREASLRASGQLERLNGGQVFLHVIPLYPISGGLNFTDDTVMGRLLEVRPFGSNKRGIERMRLEGLYLSQEVSPQLQFRHALHLRAGGLEFQRFDIVGEDAEGRRALRVRGIEDGVLSALEQARGVVEAGLLPEPVVVSLRFFGVEKTVLLTDRLESYEINVMAEDSVFIEPVVLQASELGDSPAVRRLFDVVWQAWGWARCFHYDVNSGRRLKS
jgi:hypothetical protein